MVNGMRRLLMRSLEGRFNVWGNSSGFFYVLSAGLGVY